MGKIIYKSLYLASMKRERNGQRRRKGERENDDNGKRERERIYCGNKERNREGELKKNGRDNGIA